MDEQKKNCIEKDEPRGTETKEKVERALEKIRNTDPKQLSPETRERAIKLFHAALKFLNEKALKQK